MKLSPQHFFKLFRRVLHIAALVACSGLLPAQAEALFYTLVLEWPKDSAYVLDLRNNLGEQTGITITPILQFKGHYRQTAIAVPALAACTAATALTITVQALQPQQPAQLSITSEHTVIYQQTLNSSTTASLPGFAADTCATRTDDIVGELSIAVAKPPNEATLSFENLVSSNVGHAWIEFRSLTQHAPVAFATAGTYSSIVGDDVATGINFFREIHRPANIRKTLQITQHQLERLISVIDQYVKQGTAAWTPWHNCTAFATDAWYAAIGEKLSDTLIYANAPWEVTQLGLPNSTSLYYSLLAADGKIVNQ